ncbi:MAG TPA: acyl-ACP thioesterase domain-containing protein [Solirubrobacteraceae bacterium]
MDSVQTFEFNRLRPLAPGGRTFSLARRPGFADCTPSGRMRLDALACWLQDVAYADVEDAGLAAAAVWVVRRTRIRVNRFPRFGERFRCTTFCSGLGRMWAERRTDVVGEDGERPDVEAVSLWVHLDPGSWRPVPLTEDEIETYGPSVVERRVSARLRHPTPNGGPDVRETSHWSFRRTECDIAAHVNNAAYWQPLEEELLAGPEPDPGTIDAEIEYRIPAQAGEHRLRSEGDWRWILSPEGELHASMLMRRG